MLNGSSRKVLQVDLTLGTIQEEILDGDLYHKFPGGKALAGYLLLRDLAPRIDPFSPSNILVLAVGLLTGAPLATATRFTAAAMHRIMQSRSKARSFLSTNRAARWQ